MKRYLAALLFVAAIVAPASAAVIIDDVIGVNFCDTWPKPQMAGKTADGFSYWTDSFPVGEASGSGLVLIRSGDLVTADWTSANTWAAGLEDTEEQMLYRLYLDDGGNGAQITLNGLGDWLDALGQTAYNVRVYHSTDNATGFAPVTVYEGQDLLATVQADNVWTDDGGYRAYVDTGLLSADSIMITSVRDGQNRGTIAAVKITAIPEPATMLLLGLGALILRRR